QIKNILDRAIANNKCIEAPKTSKNNYEPRYKNLVKQAKKANTYLNQVGRNLEKKDFWNIKEYETYKNLKVLANKLLIYKKLNERLENFNKEKDGITVGD